MPAPFSVNEVVLTPEGLENYLNAMCQDGHVIHSILLVASVRKFFRLKGYKYQIITTYGRYKRQ